MENYNLLHRIGKIFGLITSSTFFITLFVIIVLTVALVIINSKVKIKLPKILAGVGYLIIVVFVFIKYGSAFNGLQDTFTNKAFSSFYFPNLITYISIVLISIFVIILNFLSKTKTIVFKVISIISFGTIMSLFVIILDIVIKKEIDINSAKSIYENTDLMILIQASTFVFFIWMVIELIDYFSKKLTERSSSDKTNVSPNNYNKVSGRIGDYNISQGSNYINNYNSNRNSYYPYDYYNNQNYNYGSYNNRNYNYGGYYNNQNYNYGGYNNYSNGYNYNNNYTSNNQHVTSKSDNEYKSVNYLDESYDNNEYKSVNYLNEIYDDEYKSVNYLDKNDD